MLIFLIVATFSICQSFSSGQYVGPLSAIVTEFKGPTLSEAEIKRVINLAGKAGVTNVAKIFSYYIHPSPVAEIIVSGAETADGRKVRFPSVRIQTEGLAEEISKNLTNVLSSDGKFWVRRGKPEKNTLTVFQVRDQKIRVRVDEKVKLEQADRVVAALAAGKIRYKVTPGDAGRIDRLNFSRPESIWVSKGGGLWVSFSCGEWCSTSFECMLDKDEVVVTDTFSVIS